MVSRVYVEKKPGFDGEAKALERELRTLLGIDGITNLRIINRYDVEGIDEELFASCVPTVFSEPQTDDASADMPAAADGATVFAVEFLPGQFDQRADSASECIQLISQGERPTVRSAKVYVLEGELSAADVDAAIKKAYKDTAKKYRFPGFRAGKAPRPVIDSALGAEATLAQATNDLIAANEPVVLNELDIVPTKNGDYKELDLAKDHEDYTYTVEFSLRPAAELSSFDAVEIEMPPAEVTESEINNQVEMLLNYRATFEDVEGRAVEAEDYVTVDLKAVENADNFAAEGRMLIAGSDSNPKEFNEALIGANVDDVKTVTWTDEVEEGEEAETHTVEVTVKGIKVRNTPELTDELVKSDFGFDSIDAMRDAIKIEIEQDKASRLPAEKENRCVSALAERLQLDEMDADYEQSVFEELGQNFLSNLAARGMTLDTWLPASGLTMEQFIGDLHKQANDVARESLALDALARELKIEVTEDDINAEFEKAGVKDVEASKAEFIADGRMPAVRESIRRSKAVDHLVENAKVTEVDETAKDAE